MRFTFSPPEGRIVELPAGATPVDFAYAVHTDIGHACVGARVDRQPYPLSQPLSSGQTVEIITAPGARPNAAWLELCRQLESARQDPSAAEKP
ncbi:TGS domain-containing protein [Klebsiella pneumoniae subsp. pneumoniae]|nr:TGS domain-containing protein [Klebsiella pneumoniae subsp. pneumoniae]